MPTRHFTPIALLALVFETSCSTPQVNRGKPSHPDTIHLTIMERKLRPVTVDDYTCGLLEARRQALEEQGDYDSGRHECDPESMFNVFQGVNIYAWPWEEGALDFFNCDIWESNPSAACWHIFHTSEVFDIHAPPLLRSLSYGHHLNELLGENFYAKKLTAVFPPVPEKHASVAQSHLRSLNNK